MGLSVSHNVEDVIEDVDDVRHDLRHELQKRVGVAIGAIERDVKQYIMDDPDTSGQLLSAIGSDQIDRGLSEQEWRVYTDPEIAPYAAITEFGSGARTATPWRTAEYVAPPSPEEQPPGYPYDAPDIDNISGFAFYIEEWMREKGLTPKTPPSNPTFRASALAIAKKIDDRGTYAHPFMRPAWFNNELKVRKKARNAIKNATR